MRRETRIAIIGLSLSAAAFLLVSCAGGGGEAAKKPTETDRSPPSITIEIPTTAATLTVAVSPLVIAGTSWDDDAVAQVTWTNAATSASEVAAGTTNWSASVPLVRGDNPIDVTARDPSGNKAYASLLVTLLGVESVAWGGNYYIQLGDGSTAYAITPIQVVDPSHPSGFLQDVKQISAGTRYTVAALGNGTARSWGRNTAGRLGDGTTEDRFAPVPVVDPSDPTGLLTEVAAVSAGVWHSVALLNDGTVRAWGLNDRGQLGDGSTTDSPVPVPVVDPSHPSGILQDVISVAAGDLHTVAALADGTVRTWGANDSGQLGSGVVNDSPVPIQVIDPADPTGFLQDATDVAAGGAHTVALLADRTVRCWGNNFYGQVGDPTAGDLVPAPVQVVNPLDPSGYLQDVGSIAAGYQHTLASLWGGTAWGWGTNEYGQLGSRQGWLRNSTPLQVEDKDDPSGFLTGVVAVAAHDAHSMALKGNGGVWRWGLPGNYRTAERVEDPTDPSGFLSDVTGLGPGSYLAAYLFGNGTVRTAGSNSDGALGDGTSSRPQPEPVPVLDLSDPSGHLSGAVEVDGTWSFSAALLADGTVRTWGGNHHGQLGDGTRTLRSTAVRVLDPTDPSGFLTQVVDIDLGDDDVMAVLAGGTVRAWGLNYNGQLGDGTTEFRSLPVPVIDPSDPTGLLTDIVHISGGGQSPYGNGVGFTMALKADGTVRGWGDNWSGELGDGTRADSLVPVQTIDPGDPSGFLTGVKAITAGGHHSVALKTDGTVWAWGANLFGSLGDGTGLQSSVPVQVINPTDPTGFLTEIVEISCSYHHVMALRGDGTLWAWGYNVSGQLGDGTTTERWMPVQVVDTGDPTGLLQDVLHVDAGSQTTVAVKTDGTVRAWGRNADGQLGDGTQTDSPVPVQVRDPTDPTGFLTGVGGVASGYSHSIAIE